MTHESMATATDFFNKIKDGVLREVDNLETLRSFQSRNANIIANNHSSWCAIELALLDLFAKHEQCTVEALLGLPALRDEYQYTGVIGAGSISYFAEILRKHLEMKFNHFKIKTVFFHKKFIKLAWVFVDVD